MIDPTKEKLVRLEDVPTLFSFVPRALPTVQTIRRWIRVGVGGRKLESVKIAGRTYSSVEAVDRFVGGTRVCDAMRILDAGSKAGGEKTNDSDSDSRPDRHEH